jgi:hypothetical protein
LPLAQMQAETPHHSLQGLLERAGAAKLALSEAEWGQLRDWDAPADLE